MKKLSAGNTIDDSSDKRAITGTDYVQADSTTKRGLDLSILGGNVNTIAKPEAIRTDESSTTNTTYVGYATIGTANSAASWKVFRMFDDKGDLTITYADGDSNYDNIWDDRVTLTYS